MPQFPFKRLKIYAVKAFLLPLLVRQVPRHRGLYPAGACRKSQLDLICTKLHPGNRMQRSSLESRRTKGRRWRGVCTVAGTRLSIFCLAT
ncbi:hypothetical protein CBM2633_B10400 [Cupriavidus taiwanensis]|nr:hypothetical protein CBM2633_B10400 [Cupriavidus taiwanensis]